MPKFAVPIHMQTINEPIQFSKIEATWVEFESIRQVVAKVLSTQTLAHAALIFLFVLLYQHTQITTWLAWLAFHGLVAIARVWFASGYHDRGAHSNADAQTAFYLRYNSVISLIGFAWGSTVYLFYGQVPSAIEAIYSYYVLVYGVIATIYLSSHLQSLKLFASGYSLGLIGALLARLIFDPMLKVNVASGVLLLGVVLLISIMVKFGKQLNRVHVNSLLLQYRNQQLITSLTKEKQSALDAVATKNRMLASAAHDMRQPVLALDLYAGWLAEDPTSSVVIAPKITASTKAVVKLFDSLFDMSRLTEGQISTSLGEVNLNELMSALFVQYQPLATSKNLTLRMRAVQQSTVFTDYLLLERILGNLLTNAIKYTQTGGVLIACRKSSRGVKIEVWDTGIGISQDQQDLVFKEFYKSPSNAGTSDGFGLGLSIVSQLADLIGAELKLKSRLGRGTSVSVQLGRII
jgi:signal transduction histidine kinase